MNSFRLLPQGLIGRATLVVMCAVLIEFFGSFILYEHDEIRASRTDQAREVAELLATAAKVLDKSPESARPAVAESLATGRVKVSWQWVTGLPSANGAGELTEVRRIMEAWEPKLHAGDLRLQIAPSKSVVTPSRLSAAVELRDGSWAEVSTDLPKSVRRLVVQRLVSAAILCAGVLAAAVLLLRSMGVPLRVLAHAAETVGHGRVVHVPEEGARDLRRVARAFNSMQRRIADLLAARTQALAAVSHDLRTPLSRLRLRAGMVAEPETRVALERDVDEMSAMLDSLLAYLGGQHESEPARLTDVAATCLTLVDAVCDAGGEARYRGPDQLMATVRPTALKRAADNLVQNAITYAGSAELSLALEGRELVLAVEDDGPGIPEDQLHRVVEAFQRLDDARARNTSGLGLGLSIVERIAAGEGGVLRLSNRPQGGLRAEIRLPQAG
ncbi:ATP-binding protein [Phenylobacterium sp. LjRoot219]|uniref:ATP-binding protein n=1 Tax=Phenylobacterium sp. LjRoot219 TaxID=3342283 RepID=UPI003ECD47D3